jgi:acetate kinase
MTAPEPRGLPDALTVNAGSTSVKLSRLRDGALVEPPANLDEALAQAAPAVVLHRVVHGGDRNGPAVIDDALVDELAALTDLAPLHQPASLDAIARSRSAWPRATHIACFDTAFHRSMPAEARTYALPRRLRDIVQVYGFHGLSYAWAARQMPALAPGAGRVLVAHLGGGQSLCAIRDGSSVMTTMGFTPLDGLVMATRSGTLDPGALLYLVRRGGEDLDDVLETQSGLQGLAGTGDMRHVLQRAAAGDDNAKLAIDVWVHRFLRQAGGAIAVLGGLDALVFTGGVGEGSGPLREMVAQRMDWIGVRIGAPWQTAVQDAVELSAPDATVRTFVLHAREDLQMLHEAAELLGAA